MASRCQHVSNLCGPRSESRFPAPETNALPLDQLAAIVLFKLFQGLDAVMSAKEKEDFYLAIGYSESEKFADMSGFDKSYVGLQLTVELKKVGAIAISCIVKLTIHCYCVYCLKLSHVCE